MAINSKIELHKYTNDSKEVVLKVFPLDMADRRLKTKEIAEKYKNALRKSGQSSRPW